MYCDANNKMNPKMDTFKSKEIERLMKIYGMTYEDVIKALSPDFDDRYTDLTTIHEKSNCVLCGQQIEEVDKILIPLLERINSLNDNMVTCGSCQCDFFGWCSISFSYVGYYLFVNTLDRTYCRTHDSDEEITGFYSHFVVGLNNKYIKLLTGHYSGDDTVTITIKWIFERNMLDDLCKEFDELVK